MGDYTEDFNKFFEKAGIKFGDFIDMVHDAIDFVVKNPIKAFSIYVEHFTNIAKKLKKYKEKYGEIE